ncbi:MAG: 4'-phosphopantetheinyl transferase superfamily protein [Novosphingobium sp.]
MPSTPYNLPECVAFCATLIPVDSTDYEELFGPIWCNSEFIEGAVLKRRVQYLAGRWCAREAMRRLGHPPTPIARDHQGRPCWPNGVTGSITHSDTLAAAAVARTRDMEALGIDCEALLDTAVAREIAGLVAAPDEITRATAIGPDNAAGISLIFSAKEALYKCLNPIVRRFFDHREAELVEVDAAVGRFLIRLLVDLDTRFRAGRVFEGSFGIGDGHVHTTIALPR